MVIRTLKNKIKKRGANKKPALKRVSGGPSDAVARRRKENEAAKKRRAAGIKSNVKSAPKTGSKRYGVGSNKTINGQANVSVDQLRRAGLSLGPQGLRKYMNAWNKTGKRPTKATFSKPVNKEGLTKSEVAKRSVAAARGAAMSEAAKKRRAAELQKERRKKLSDLKVDSAMKQRNKRKLAGITAQMDKSAEEEKKRKKNSGRTTVRKLREKLAKQGSRTTVRYR